MQQHRRPDAGGGDRRGHDAAAEPRVAASPHGIAPGRDRPPDRRGQGDRVVGVDDPPTEAEGGPGHDQPTAPQEEGGAGPVRPARPRGRDQATGQQHQGGRQQPRDLRTHVGAEQPGDPGRAPHARATGASGATDAAGLVAGQAAEAVVAEHEIPDAVVLRPPDVRAVGGRREHHGHHPPARRHDQRGPAEGEVLQPSSHRAAAPPPDRPTRDRERRGTPAAFWPGTRTPRARRPA